MLLCEIVELYFNTAITFATGIFDGLIHDILLYYCIIHDIVLYCILHLLMNLFYILYNHCVLLFVQSTELFGILGL